MLCVAVYPKLEICMIGDFTKLLFVSLESINAAFAHYSRRVGSRDFK